ncbi:hypothetical protein LH433_10280 [Laribacter hongkongensis]|uniref:hypothetical protein n=1 Tax=Laribacter hongkongensis TaxID=168471 RepID=UPI001EFDD030|nr:hypothetical protein [Laribacter hongkongensis]MCG9029704.1 hypothetical protein [Laribacter hongkongensis]MCG9035831.1 hypothetical protein [Laribacter hongkongensis]MCG9038553.1 hypothetical protein [Laribacter hongkongensis]MCG9071512.1 hypothetical protein [Laribacter hongkongensis]MCG9107131.1 hypothetical protein [Laribacter hongkongensis]
MFFYVLFAGLLLQKVVLPLIPWHAGHGLLAGGDWVWFHSAADQLAALIEEGGWVHWELRPEGNAPIGITAALYALSGFHELWVVLPVNASLYAMSAVLLWHGMRMLTCKPEIALAALLPMFLFPSTAMIWGQIHKDVWVLAGAMGLVWGLVRIGREGTSLKTCVALIGLAGVCTLLIWLMRSYANAIFFVASAIGVVVLAILMRPCGVTWWLAAGSFLFAQATVITFVAQANAHLHPQGEAQAQLPEQAPGAPCDIWQQQPPVLLLDNQLAGLACVREAFRHGYPNAGSNIDTEVGFRNARDIAAYVPRALQIALFAPFPDMWAESPQQPGGAVKRLLAVPEMIFYYLALVGCVLAAVKSHGRERVILASLVSFSLVSVLVYTLAVTNVGTLYRMRYPAMLLLCALGIWGWSIAVRRNVSHDSA